MALPANSEGLHRATEEHFQPMPIASTTPVPALTLAEYHRQVANCWGSDPFTAYELATSGLGDFPDDLLLKQKQAHALARTGSPQRARAILDELVARGHKDAETMGLLGRVWKDVAKHAASESDRIESLRRSRECYARGLSEAETAGDPNGYYPGINAASLSIQLGERDVALDFAHRTESCLNRSGERNYWALATLAEVALIRGDAAGARRFFSEAVTFHPAPEQMSVTRRQARILAKSVLGDAAICDDCFHLPPLVVFIGHLTDEPGRTPARFPESMVPLVRERLAASLAAHGTRIAYASAARGGDLLFLRCMQEMGAETHIVLPLEEEAFRKISVDTPAEPAWTAMYHEALACAKSVRVASRRSSSSDPLVFEFALRILIGLAKLRARLLEVEVRAIVMWDTLPGDGSGGTAWAVQELLRQGIPIENIHPDHPGPIQGTAPPAGPEARDDERAIRAILFSDCKGYSKLGDEETVDYSRRFLTAVARLLQSTDDQPLTTNTWGDGLFLVFRDVAHAGRFAIRLRDAAGRAAEYDLPPGIRLRIGMHAGPVSPLHDPVTQRPNFVGVNISLAARIEPITQENQIYASESFAALCAEANLTDFTFDYVGSTPLAKDYGAIPLYQFQ